MKAVLFVFAALCVGYLNAVFCPNNNVQTECTSLSCSTGYHRACVNGVCTCNPNQAVSCTYQSDCTGNCNREWHCVDNFCRCGGNFGK